MPSALSISQQPPLPPKSPLHIRPQSFTSSAVTRARVSKIPNSDPKRPCDGSIDRRSLGQSSSFSCNASSNHVKQSGGKRQVQRICNKIFDEWPEKDKGLIAFKDLHIVTLMVYSSVNKQFLSPYKEPPSMEVVQKKVKDLSSKTTAISREQFYEIIMEWIQKDLHIVLANRVLLALLASPLLAIQTKNAGRQIPRIGSTVDKVPTPLIASVYSIGIVLLQDMRMT